MLIRLVWCVSRTFADALDSERVRQMEVVMQTRLEKTRDVRRRRHLDALHIPVLCRLEPLAAGIPAPRKKHSRRRHKDEDDVDDDDADDADEAAAG